MNQSSFHMPDHLMDQAREFSKQENISIDQFLVSLMTEGLAQYKAVLDMRWRAAKGNPEAALHILNHVVPNVAPDPGDELRSDSNRSPDFSM